MEWVFQWMDLSLFSAGKMTQAQTMKEGENEKVLISANLVQR